MLQMVNGKVFALRNFWFKNCAFGFEKRCFLMSQPVIKVWVAGKPPWERRSSDRHFAAKPHVFGRFAINNIKPIRRSALPGFNICVYSRLKTFLIFASFKILTLNALQIKWLTKKLYIEGRARCKREDRRQETRSQNKTESRRKTDAEGITRL